MFSQRNNPYCEMLSKFNKTNIGENFLHRLRKPVMGVFFFFLFLIRIEISRIILKDLKFKRH